MDEINKAALQGNGFELSLAGIYNLEKARQIVAQAASAEECARACTRAFGKPFVVYGDSLVMRW